MLTTESQQTQAWLSVESGRRATASFSYAHISPFYRYDFDLEPVTFTHERDLDILKMSLHTTRVVSSEIYFNFSRNFRKFVNYKYLCQSAVLKSSIPKWCCEIACSCQCQYEIYSAPITKRTWVHYIVTELVNSCYIVLKAKLKQIFLTNNSPNLYALTLFIMIYAQKTYLVFSTVLMNISEFEWKIWTL